MMSETQEQLIMFGETHIRQLLDARDLHDFRSAAEYLELMIPGALPFIGKPVFETLEMLDRCIRTAKISTFEEECIASKIKVMAGDVMLLD